MNTWKQIGAFILLILLLAEVSFIVLIPYNINSIAESLKEISKSLKEKNK